MNKDILIFWLEERYKSIHIIRDRVHTTSIWLLWILLWLSWTVIKLDIKFTCYEKIFFLIIVILSWLVILFFYYFDLEKWFNIQRNIASKIENKLWFFDWRDSLYPETWKNSTNWYFFRNNYILIWFWFLILITTIIIFI